jgi:hypothetical protein
LSDKSDRSDLSDPSEYSIDSLLVLYNHLNIYFGDSPLLPHGGYRRLRSYKVAEAVYDATVVFCRRFIPKSDRTHDQMVQAARSGVRNISEGQAHIICIPSAPGPLVR